MKLPLKSALLFTLIALCLGATALRSQIVNPTFAILTLEQYRDYYSFYLLNEHLDAFARLGVLAALLLLSAGLLAMARDLRLDHFLHYSRRGERFSWPWQANAFCSVLVLGLIWQFGLLLILCADLVSQDFSGLHLVGLTCLSLVPLLGVPLLSAQVPEHKLLRWPLGGFALTGVLLGSQVLNLARQLDHSQFAIPPLLSTHYGPWGLLALIGLLGCCLGLAVGATLLALQPDPQAEPDSLNPRERRKTLAALALGTTLSLTLLSLYPGYLVPRYQVGQDLRDVLDLVQGRASGRTVIFLDQYDEPHTLEDFDTWSSATNLQALETWMVNSPRPSALTRPAGKILSDTALWNWRPDDALDWLEVHRRRLVYSNLNQAFLQAVEAAKPGPRAMKHLDALLDRDRFAWPGAGSRLKLAQQLRRYGRGEEAEIWEAEAAKLTQNLQVQKQLPPTGVIRGRLFLDGEPAENLPVALFRGQEAEELLQRTRTHIALEESLHKQHWRPTYYQYVDFQRLTNFYAVDTTDADGFFLFEDVEEGLFRLAVRCPQVATFSDDGGLLELRKDEEVDLGSLQLSSTAEIDG